MTRTPFRWWVAAGTLVLAACTGGSEEAGSSPQPVALVTLSVAEQGAVARELTLYGAAEPGPAARITLVAPAEGTLVAVEAPVGAARALGKFFLYFCKGGPVPLLPE